MRAQAYICIGEDLRKTKCKRSESSLRREAYRADTQAPADEGDDVDGC